MTATVHASAEDLDEQLEVTGGVDTHLDSHVAAVLDHRGVELATKAFPTDRAGHQALLAWMTSFGTVAVIGVEGTGSYGAGLARFIAAEGVALVEVNRSNRQLRRRHGKSDPLDAVAAARAAQSGTATGHAKGRDGTVEAIRVLRVTRRSARMDRVRAINQLKGLVATAPDELREPLRPLGRRQLVATCKAFRPGEDLSPVAATKYALRLLAQRVTRLETELEDLDEQLQALVEAAASALLAEHAVGTDTAGALLVAAGDNPKRLRSEAAFAQLCGVVAPAGVLGEGGAAPIEPGRGPPSQRRPLAHRAHPAPHPPAHPRVRATADRRGPLQGGDHALPEALRRPRALPAHSRRGHRSWSGRQLKRSSPNNSPSAGHSPPVTKNRAT